MGILSREKNLPTSSNHVQKVRFGNFLGQTTMKMTLQSESHSHHTLTKSLFPIIDDNLGLEEVTSDGDDGKHG